MRLFVWAILVFGALSGAALGALGAATVATGRSGGWLALLLGVQTALMCVLLCVDLRRYRGTPPPAMRADDGVALPLRPGFVRRRALVVLLLGTLCLTAGAAGRSVVGVLLGLAGFALFSAYAAWLAFRADHRIRLDPQGLRLAGTREPIAWRDVVDASVDSSSWQPYLVVRTQGGAQHAASLVPQAWSGAALAELIRRAGRHTAYRRELDSPEAVERFRPS